MILLSLILLLAAVLFAIVAGGVYRTYAVEHMPEQAKFTSGKVSEPNGFYNGNEQTGIGESWKGKSFNQAEQTGINRFNNGDRYVFKTYSAKGLRDKNTDVLKIDYNQPGNPWWLKFVVDEIVEVKPDRYLGKVHLKLIPRLPITLMYFQLSK